MPNPERHILRALKQVGQVEPTPDSTRRAIERAREAILSVEKSASHRFFWRIIMPTSIAATVLAAITLLSVLLTNHSATAAETLKEVAAANQAYKGWIHAKAEQIPSPEHGGPRSTAISFHVNAQKQIYVEVDERGTERVIEWINRREGVYQQYNSARNELVSRDVPSNLPIFQIQEQVKARKRLSPAELTGLLVIQPTMDSIMALVDYGCTVTQQEEASYERFDLTLPKAMSPGNANDGKPLLTALFDKKTRLLQRCSSTGTADGTELALSYTYGAPDIQSIYDLGVPKTTPMLSQRTEITPQLKPLLDRLDSRVGEKEHLGNYVAISTCTLVNPTLPPAPLTLEIHSRNGNQWFFGKYTKVRERKLDLEGWPTPGMATVRSAQGEKPDDLFVSDGTRSWNGLPKGAFNARKTSSPLVYAESYLLSGTIWPARWRFSGNFSAEVQDAGDRQYPGFKLISRGGDFGLVEEQWRLDPARDDVPVTSSRTIFKKDGSILEDVQTKYQDYAQLPGGQWYPTRWTSTATWPSRTDSLTLEYRLQILPGEHLDALWFTDPTKRFANP